MKYIIVFFVLAAMSVLGRGEEYMINAKRVYQQFRNNPHVMLMDSKIQAVQDVTYYEEISVQYDIAVRGVIENEASDFYYENEDNIDPCKYYENDNWDFVIASIVEKGLFPEGKCPVQPGKYKLYENVEAITVNFADQIDCGNYNVTLYLRRPRGEFAFIQFEFTIDDDGNCLEVSESSESS